MSLVSHRKGCDFCPESGKDGYDLVDILKDHSATWRTGVGRMDLTEAGDHLGSQQK